MASLPTISHPGGMVVLLIEVMQSLHFSAVDFNPEGWLLIMPESWCKVLHRTLFVLTERMEEETQLLLLDRLAYLFKHESMTFGKLMLRIVPAGPNKYERAADVIRCDVNNKSLRLNNPTEYVTKKMEEEQNCGSVGDWQLLHLRLTEGIETPVSSTTPTISASKEVESEDLPMPKETKQEEPVEEDTLAERKMQSTLLSSSHSSTPSAPGGKVTAPKKKALIYFDTITIEEIGYTSSKKTGRYFQKICEAYDHGEVHNGTIRVSTTAQGRYRVVVHVFAPENVARNMTRTIQRSTGDFIRAGGTMAAPAWMRRGEADGLLPQNVHEYIVKD
jgi:hypothetical protein